MLTTTKTCCDHLTDLSPLGFLPFSIDNDKKKISRVISKKMARSPAIVLIF